MNRRHCNTADKGVAFGGVLSGEVALDASVGGVGAGAVEGIVSFGFDTRDGSWSAATTMRFTSEMVNATAVVAANSGCTEAGTLGSGSISMTFGGEGSSNLNAGVTCVKRCGAWAKQYGSMIVKANVSKSKIVLEDNLVLNLNNIDLKLVGNAGTPGDNEAGAGAIDFGAADDDENALAALTWNGALVAEDVTLSMPETGLSLTGGVSVKFDIGLDKKPVLTGVDATLVVEYNMAATLGGAENRGERDEDEDILDSYGTLVRLNHPPPSPPHLSPTSPPPHPPPTPPPPNAPPPTTPSSSQSPTSPTSPTPPPTPPYPPPPASFEVVGELQLNSYSPEELSSPAVLDELQDAVAKISGAHEDAITVVVEQQGDAQLGLSAGLAASRLGAQAACTQKAMRPGCKCGSEGGGNGVPDNPFPSTGLCCHKPTKTVVKGEQKVSFTWCKDNVPGPPTSEGAVVKYIIKTEDESAGDILSQQIKETPPADVVQDLKKAGLSKVTTDSMQVIPPAVVHLPPAPAQPSPPPLRTTSHPPPQVIAPAVVHQPPATTAVVHQPPASNDNKKKKGPPPLVAVKGSVTLAWPCDEESGGAPVAPLLSGEVSIEVNFEAQGATVHRARGKFTVACGGYPVELDASADSLTFAGVTVKNIAIKINVEVNPADNATYARGSISGKIGYGATSLEAFYMFNTLTGDFTAAVALEFEKPPLFMRVEAQVSNVCTAKGNSLQGKLNYSDAPTMVAIADAKGVAHCVDPDNATALRYELNIELDELSVADDALKLTNVSLVASGYGTHDTSLKGLEWNLGVWGSMETSSGTETSSYAVAASADVVGKLSYNPATQTFTDPSFSLDMNVSGAVGTALAFKARAKYTYPCKDMIAVTSTMSLDLGDAFNLKDLAGSLTIYCPGMEASARARRAFSASVALTQPVKASFSGVKYTVDRFVLNAEGKESLDVSPDANAKSWVPLPSLSTVDIEGTILARASVSYDSDGGGEKAVARVAAEAELGFKAGAALALTGYFKKTAGVTKIDTEVNVTASAYFDYASEDGSVEVHLTAAGANNCPPEGNSVKGTFAINKPGVIKLDATVSGVQFCADGVEETAFKIEAVVQEALVGGLVSLRSIVITLEISGSPLGRKDVSAEGAAKRRYAGSFKGTVGVEALMELIPDVNANAASVTASGAFVKAPGAALELTEGVDVLVDVDLEFGAGSKITGVAAFQLPCTVDSPPINISAEVSFNAPLPELNSGKAELIVYCGRGANFHLVVDVDTFEVTEGVVFDHVHVDISGMKNSSTWNMWAVTGTVVGSGSATAGAADGGKLLWSGDITFDTGPKGVLQVAEAIEESLPVDFTPPPPTPPSTPPPVAAFDDSNCCNPNADVNYFLPGDKCCAADTMRVVEGAQCLSSRWCKSTGCFSSVKKISRTQKCVELPGDVISPPPPRLPPSPPPQPEVSDDLPERQAPAPSLEGCCNANSMDTKQYFTLEGDSCCDTGSLRIRKGAQCSFSRWCKKGQSMDCGQAAKNIPKGRTCKTVVAAGVSAGALLGAQATCTREAMVVGCNCDSRGKGYNGDPDNPKSTSVMCCHKGTRTVVKGEQLLSFTWCKDNVAGPVVQTPPPSPPPPDSPSPPPLTPSPPPPDSPSPPPLTVVQEEEAAAAEEEEEEEASYIVKKTYNVDANLALVYSDGNVVVTALGHVHVGSSACEGIQAKLLGNLTIVEHGVKADGNITLHCPAADGSRQIDAAVTVDSWQIVQGVSLVDAAVHVEAVKGGGAQGTGSSMSVQGEASGVVKISAGTGGAPDMTTMQSSVGVDVTLTAQATFKKPACESVATMSTRSVSGATSLGAVKAAAAGGCNLKIEKVIVDVDFSVVKGDDAEKPEFWVKGNAQFQWPCASGQHISAEAAFGLNIGEYSIPKFTVTAKLFCNVTDPLMPVFILKGKQSDAPIVLGTASLENVAVELRAYRQGILFTHFFKP